MRDLFRSLVITAALTALIVLVAQAATYTFAVTGTATSAGGGGGGGALPGSILPAHPGGGNWTLTFNDEFNGTSLDTTKWQATPDGSSNGFDCHVVNSTITEGGGFLTMPLAAGASLCGGGAHAGSVIGTGNSAGINSGLFGPGYYEARVSMDTDGQSMGSFWMSDGWGNTFADNVEVDFFENFGCSASGGLVYAPGGARTPVNMVQYTNPCGFHVWGLWYQANGPLTYFMDGVQQAQTGPGNPNGTMGTKADFTVIFDNTGAGNDGSTSPMQVDWFRYYK